MKLRLVENGYQQIFDGFAKVEENITAGIVEPEKALERLRKARSALFELRMTFQACTVIEPDREPEGPAAA